jgi:transcriptional regulator with XRE-family HTH domain
MSLREAVRSLRKAHGWTQIELARRSGIAQGMLTNIETGKQANPTHSTLQRLARAFEISVDELLRTAGLEDPPVNFSEENNFAQWSEEIIAIGEDLPAADRQAVLEHARALRDRLDRS